MIDYKLHAESGIVWIQLDKEFKNVVYLFEHPEIMKDEMINGAMDYLADNFYNL